MEEQAGDLHFKRQHSWCWRYGLALMRGLGAYILQPHCISMHFHRSTQAKNRQKLQGAVHGNRLQLHRPCNDMRGSWQDGESLAAWLEAEREATLALSLAHQDQICLASPSTSHWYTLMQIDSCIGRWPHPKRFEMNTPLALWMAFAPSIKAST